MFIVITIIVIITIIILTITITTIIISIIIISTISTLSTLLLLLHIIIDRQALEGSGGASTAAALAAGSFDEGVAFCGAQQVAERECKP